jgi:site-specific DNA recombinase
MYAASEEIYPMRQHLIYAAYVRESDPSLENSATIESQKQAVREYCEKHGYELSEDLIYADALSSTKLPYRKRPQVMKALEDAGSLFHVLIVNEYGRLARKQTEQAVLIEFFKEKGVEVLSCTEQFDDSPSGNYLRSAYAFQSEVEALKIAERTYRGKVHRAKLGQRMLGMNKSYGYSWKDETKSACFINDTIFYVDPDGTEWSEHKVVVFVFDRLDEGWSLRKVRNYLFEKGVPTQSGKPVWARQTIHQIAANPSYTGKAAAFRWKAVEGKQYKVMRDEGDTIPLPEGTIPAIVPVEQFERIQKLFAQNKQDAARNSKWPEVGLMRAGFTKCGVCGKSTQMKHYAPNGYQVHAYECWDVGTDGKRCGVNLRIDSVDAEAWMMAVEHIRNPQLVINHANKIMQERKDQDDGPVIRKRIDEVRKKIANLVSLAEDATDKDELEDIRGRIAGKQKEKRELEKMLIDIDNEEEKRMKVDKAIADFIAWCVKVRPFIDDPDYIPTYCEMRRAIVILGIVATIYPAGSKKRFTLDLMPPSILEAIIVSQLSSRSCPASSTSSCTA